MEEKDVRGLLTLYWYSLKSLLEERFPLANAISLTAFLSPVRYGTQEHEEKIQGIQDRRRRILYFVLYDKA